MALFATILVASPVFADTSLRLTTRLPAGTHYVGQAIEVGVEVEGATGLPTVEPPRSTALDVHPLPSDGARRDLWRFAVVPRQAGTLDLPPFRARSGDRSGNSKPIRLAVASVPLEGRTAAFLGGVGPFEIRAEAEPRSVQLGQTLEYRVKLTGPAAWGSVRSPDLASWTSLALGFRLEPLPDVLEGPDSPGRTFRYRLRPSKSGRAVLPPVAVAAFDPTTGRYATRVTASLPIRVEEPPRFDPGRLDYRPIAEVSSGDRSGVITIALAAALFVAATLAGFVWRAGRRRLARRIDPRRLALELARGLGEVGDRGEAARAVAEAFSTFLQRADGRGPGVLTPPESREAVARLTRDRDLARRAERLIERCDRSSYGDGSGDGSGLIAEGRELFEGIARAVAREEGPREAVETA